MAKMLKITLTKSTIGAIPKHKKVVKALGLRKLHHSVELADTPQTRGAIAKVTHLVTVEELQDRRCKLMKLHELKAPAGSTHSRKRKGRGTATGQGKTAGRGMNGQNSRSGGGVRLGFEGGQMPLYRRLPKRGFNNKWAKEYATVNVGDLNRFEANTEVTPELLREVGLVKQVIDGVKILGDGELDRALTVKAVKFTKTAAEKINAAGGKAEVI